MNQSSFNSSDPSKSRFRTTSVQIRVFAGSTVSRRETAHFYRGADVFILPTLSDGFALTQLEAFANRVPVIASQFCGDVVRDGIDGIVLREPTPAAIQQAIQGLINNPELVARFSQATQIRDELGLKALGEKLVTLG